MVLTVVGLILTCAPFAYGGARYLISLRGDLAGYWYQVTYHPDDKKMSEPCFSIELMRLRHRGDTVKGTWWRIYKVDFKKKWSFEGKTDGAFVIGSYFASSRSKAGGSGNFFMMEIGGEGRVKGRFTCVVVEDTASGGVGFEPEMWPMEWLRVDHCSGAKLAAWVQTLPDRACDCTVKPGVADGTDTRHAAIDHLPWYARRALGHAGWPNARKETQKGLGYAAAISTPLPATALEGAERQADATARRKVLPVPDLSRFDILGPIRSPRERPAGEVPVAES